MHKPLTLAELELLKFLMEEPVDSHKMWEVILNAEELDSLPVHMEDSEYTVKRARIYMFERLSSQIDHLREGTLK